MQFNYHESLQNTASSRWVIGVIGGISALLGILVMIGWQLHLTTLTQGTQSSSPHNAVSSKNVAFTFNVESQQVE